MRSNSGPDIRAWYSSAHLGAREHAWAASSKCPQRHGRVAFFPFTPVCLKALKPLPYAREPKTLGEHLKRRRYKLGLRQKDAAGKLQISQSTYITWEADRVEPEIRYWPKIIDLLGFDPFAGKEGTLGERLQAKYRELGIPRKRAAILLGIDEGTLLRYERGEWQPGKRNIEIIERFLARRP